jgi:PhnB protein
MSTPKMAEGHHSVTPYLVVKGAEQQIDFLKKVFNAEEKFKMLRPDSGGAIMHCEIQIGDSRIMLADVTPEHTQCNAMLYVYVENTDESYQKALNAGATSLRAPVDEDYGARSAGVLDAFGNKWWFATLK